MFVFVLFVCGLRDLGDVCRWVFCGFLLLLIKAKYVSIIIVLFKFFLLELLIINQFPFFLSEGKIALKVSGFLNIRLVYLSFSLYFISEKHIFVWYI